MLYTCSSQVQWQQRSTAVVAVLLAIAVLTAVSAAQKLSQTPTKSGSTSTAASSLSQNNINYFVVNEANTPLAVLDLLEATMQIYHNFPHHFSDNAKNDTTSFTTGVTLVALSEDDFSHPDVFPPNRLRPAYNMQGTSRQLKVPEIVYKRAVQLLKNADELTIAAVVRQERANTGSIVSFTLDSNRYFELESSGRKDEVRFHYVSLGNRRVHTEVFAYALADGHWHAVALTLSGAQARLFIDCRLVYTRTLTAGPADTSFTDSPDLFVGQRNSGVHSVFKGLLQDVRLIRGADGQRVQCPNLDTSCPTCGQFVSMQKTMENLNQMVHLLSNRLEAAETRIAELETCECRKPCIQLDERNNSTMMKFDGSVWQHECKTCTCMRGQVECAPVKCPPIKCKFPIRKSGECCDTCQKSCRTQGDIIYEHGETVYLDPCLSCICENGVSNCHKVDISKCPALECDVSEQFSVPDQCCKFCPGIDYCARGGLESCHPNATCINLKITHKCSCVTGYAGTGFQCDDVDECSNIGGPNGHHCDANTTMCVNTPGSYACQCKTGYKRMNRYECVDVDECSDRNSPCHPNAKCVNWLGGYSCTCSDGYEGDGHTCKPVCAQKCLNGGVCSRPGVCSCPNAFEGPACELDVDECATGAHGCIGPSSRCVNMAGWYYCACSPGYQNVIMTYPETADSSNLNVLESTTWSPLMGTMCQDIDECATNNHTCHPSATCINTVGSYECKCPTLVNSTNVGNNSSECKLSCLYKDNNRMVTEVDDGASIASQECTNCTCTSGNLRCARIQCDCMNSDHVQSICCAHCNAQASCAHQELTDVRFHSGQQWIYQCQTCECLLGQVDCWPMQCPPMLHHNVIGCSDSVTTKFADYNDPEVDCCASRFDSKDTLPILTTTTAVTTSDPCTHDQLDGHHHHHHHHHHHNNHRQHDDGNDDGESNNNNSNHTIPITLDRPCFYEGRHYQSGARWDDPVDMCTSCDCKDGVPYCSYNNCNNSDVVAGTASYGMRTTDIDHDVSARESRDDSNENVSSQSVDGESRKRVVKRSLQRRVTVVVDGGGGGGGGIGGIGGGNNNNKNNFNQKDWWWRKTRRRKRIVSQDTSGRRYQINRIDGEKHNSNGRFVHRVDVDSKNEDNNNIVNNDNDSRLDRIAVKTVVVT